MTSKDLENIINRLCYEFQSIWIIDIKDLSMTIFRDGSDRHVEETVSTVKNMGAYLVARKWYVEQCIVPQDRERVFAQTDPDLIISKIKDGNPYSLEYSRIINGVANYNQCYFAKFEPDDEELQHFILGFRDVDVRKKAELDDLTGVYTRQVFFQKAEALLKDHPERQFDLMISDIVDFKGINELYGSAIGDEILRRYGNVLAMGISDEVLVGRYGGDQFVLLSSHEFIEAAAKAENQSWFFKDDIAPKLPKTVVKFGVYQNVKHDKSLISTCDKAHLALNSIKHQYDKMIAVYDDSLRHSLDVERKIEGSMYDALEQGQFKVFYQPKHDTITGALVGAEALIRWVHPEYGFMSPADFIPLFERNGFIVQADYYVWKRTCSNLRRWIDAGIRVVPISVNSSKLTFKQENMLDYLGEITDQFDIDPSLIHLEITETLMEDDTDALVARLQEIKAKGYQIELDDFGSGYSSLNILSALPLDVVKLDMSFMKQFGDEKRAKVLAACIKLAKELGYKTVSEGVELEEQNGVLAHLGVDAIQGYYYSKPLPEEEFEKYMIQKMG